MTDGIIQEVFKQFNMNHPYSKSKDYINQESIDKLQQELIEKIKQEFAISKPFQHVFGVSKIHSILIGDNQE